MRYKIEFECGTNTCASMPGRFCRFVRTKRFGQEWVCGVFMDTEGQPQRLFDNEDGWLARCEQCRMQAIKVSV